MLQTLDDGESILAECWLTSSAHVDSVIDDVACFCVVCGAVFAKWIEQVPVLVACGAGARGVVFLCLFAHGITPLFWKCPGTRHRRCMHVHGCLGYSFCQYLLEHAIINAVFNVLLQLL